MPPKSFPSADPYSSCSPPERQGNEIPTEKRIARQRISRACDACRKMKIKCPLSGAGPCQNCEVADRPCTFENTGVKRERPPTKRDIQRLNSMIKSLERCLEIMAPDLDLSNIPEPTDQDHHHSLEKTDQFPSCDQLAGESHNPVNEVTPAINSMAAMHISPTPALKGQSRDRAPAAGDLPEGIDNANFPSPDFMPSVVESHIVTHHANCAAINKHIPPPDLARSLISLFFDKVNKFENIIHQGEFMHHYDSGLAQNNASFCALCFAIYAAGSRFSSDPRVLHPGQDGKPDPQAAGGVYLASSALLISPFMLPCTLFDLQTMAMLCYMTTASCSPLTAWFSTGSYLRRAQNAGAHREDTPRWKTSILKDQLRKRAMWYLISREIQLCMCLGRGSIMKHNDLDLEFPLCVDDITLSRLCEYASLNNIHGIHQFSQEFLETLSVSKGFIAMKAFFSVKQRFGRGLQKVLAGKTKPESKAWNWDPGMVSALARDIDAYCKHHIPPEARWSPDIKDVQDFVISARLNGGSLSLQIAIHRLLISDDPLEIKACLRASSTLIDILEHIRSRGMLEETASWSPYMVTPPALTFLYAACGHHDCISPADRANAWADMHRCINILTTLSSTTFLADRLRASLDQLVQTCIEEELFPDSSTPMANSRKRDACDMPEYESQAPWPMAKVPALAESELVACRTPDSTYPTRLSSPISDLPAASGQTSMHFPQPLTLGSNFFSMPPSQLDASLFECPGLNVNTSFMSFNNPQWSLGGASASLASFQPDLLYESQLQHDMVYKDQQTFAANRMGPTLASMNDDRSLALYTS